jgi:hypothetical protein
VQTLFITIPYLYSVFLLKNQYNKLQILMKRNLIQTFALCYIFMLAVLNVASAQCENFEPPFMIPGDVVEICPGGTAFVEVNPIYTSYIWSTGETTSYIMAYFSGDYFVTVTDANGCTGEAVAFVIESYLDVTISVTENSGSLADDGTICQGDAATLSAMVNGTSGGYTYNWSNGATTSDITVTTAGTYMVSVTDWNGCYMESSTTIVETPFTPPYVFPDYIEACEGEFIMLDAGAGYNTYSWSTGETTQIIYPYYTGYYEVTVTSSDGCEGTAGSTVILHYMPYPFITVSETSGVSNDDGVICQGDDAILSAMVEGGTGSEYYSWSTGENTQNITVSSSGTYSVFVTNEYGCYSESYISITVSSPTDPACQNCEIPTNESIEMTTTTTALFDWDDMSNAIFYQVKYRLKGTAAWSTTGTSSSQRSVANLQTKKYYQYKVRAQCADESWSDYTAVTTFYTSQCSAPTGVASIYLDNTRMRVRWDNNPNEIKGKVRYRVAGTSTWTTQNSANGNNYLYVNNLPANATIQYRVRSNCDGNDWSEYSPLMTHDLNPPRLAQEAVLENIKLYPNPAKEVLTVEFETENGEEANIIITDNLGKTIRSQNNTYTEGIQKEIIDVANLTNGYYFITIRSNDSIETQKFMKMK